MTVETPLLIIVGILVLQSQVCSKIILSFQTSNIITLNRCKRQRLIKIHQLKDYRNHNINKNSCNNNKDDEPMMMRSSNQGQSNDKTSSSSIVAVVNDGDNRMQFFQTCLQRCGLPENVQHSILHRFLDSGFTNSVELYTFAVDFTDRPEVLSSILRQDFNFSIIDSHRARAALMELIRYFPIMAINKNNYSIDSFSIPLHNITSNTSSGFGSHIEVATNDRNTMVNRVIDAFILPLSDELGHKSQQETMELPQPGANTKNLKPDPQRRRFKSVLVNKNAAKRFEKSGRNSNCHNYGLPNRDGSPALYSRLQDELDQFFLYMTEPSAMFKQQEDPIRKATADVYIRHARLFLGWYTNDMKVKKESNNNNDNNNKDTLVSNNDHSTSEVSLFTIIPDRESRSAQPIVDYILWLRKQRDISDSYEANLLRGLTKLIKYRFASESNVDTSYGDKSFQDIPVVRELRRLHRDANKRQSLSPRSSDEGLKWISWEEYLGVVEALKNDLLDELHRYNQTSPLVEQKGESMKSSIVKDAPRRRIAIKFQNYLVLAFFSCIPDRQRTFRELQLGRTFLRDESSNYMSPRWIIKHGKKDYKTGGTYGDRPPLVLAPELTAAIDDFLERWRPCLRPTGPHVFVQPRTGKCFTQDSIYATVCRCCFRYTGKRTNPHLLRDMIVTHVRQSDASEKELEALALYMGHSITMQRNSYDRRTMQEKVAPAIDLLQSMNKRSE